MAHPSNQARANDARRRQAKTGESYAAALDAVRKDRLRKIDALEADSATPAVLQDDLHEVPVPKELTELVRYHADRVTSYLAAAVDEGRWQADDFADWQRMTLYKLTDGLAHLHLLIGTITAYLRDAGTSEHSLQRYLQVGEARQVEAFITPRVQEHLAGLTNGEKPEDSVVWYDVGSCIAEGKGWSNPDRHDALEGCLYALYTGYPDDPEALDHLPQDLRKRVLALLPHVRSTK